MAAPARHLQLIATGGELVGRPRTRGECGAVPRPCPHATCKHNLSADTLPGGTRQVHWVPEDEPRRPSCALDMAEEGDHTLEEIADILGVTKARVGQILDRAVGKILRNARAFRDYR